MKNVFCIILLLLSVSVAAKNGNSLELKIDGAKTGDRITIMTTNIENKLISDTSYVFEKDGELNFTTSKSDIMLRLFLSSPNKRDQQKMIYVGNGSRYNIEGSSENFDAATISGDYFNTPSFKAIDQHNKNIDSLTQLAISAMNSKDKEKLDDISRQVSTERASSISSKINFTTQNPSNSYSAYLISSLLGDVGVFEESPSIEKLATIYNSLTEKTQKSHMGIEVSEKIFYLKNSSEGALVPNFKLTSLDGKIVSPSDFRGKWLLIDFWASWCGPCRRSNPEMVTLYNKYKSTGLEIVGVDCFDTPEDWKAVIEKDGLPWIHVSSDEKIDGQVHLIKLFEITGVPTVILVSPEGEIVFRGHPVNVKQKLEAIFN